MKAKKESVLIVDDNRDNLRLLSSILAKQTYNVRLALTGADALEGVHKKLPDLILLDIKLPDMSGYEVCERLKANARTCDVPVIFISVLNEVSDKLKAFSAGGVDYITKPFYAEEVMARVEMQISIQRIQRTLEKKNKQLLHEQNRAKKFYDEHETELKKRTSELVKTNERLIKANLSLNGILKRKQKGEESIKESVTSNIKDLVFPYLKKLKKSRLTKAQRTLVDIMETNLDKIASPFVNKLSSKYLDLTPTEIRVAHFVKDGKRNKEIAQMMNLSLGTILTHRHSIRRKLGLRNKKVNLKKHLISMD